MQALIVVFGMMAASIVYVYRFRGEARYKSLNEYFRKGWPIFTPFNCILYATTLRRGSGAVLDPDHFPELDVLRRNWQTIRDEGLELVRESYFDATKRPRNGRVLRRRVSDVLQVWLEPVLSQMVRLYAPFSETALPENH